MLRTGTDFYIYQIRVSENDIEKSNYIIKGREITEAERKEVYNFLIENNIIPYTNIYKNAIRRYATGDLYNRFNSFSRFPTKKENKKRTLTRK